MQTFSGVAVHAAEEIVDAEIGHEDSEESKYHVDVVSEWATENG